MVLNPNKQSSRRPLLVERDVTCGVKHEWMGGEVKNTMNNFPPQTQTVLSLRNPDLSTRLCYLLNQLVFSLTFPALSHL